jgi:hypothetical protein
MQKKALTRRQIMTATSAGAVVLTATTRASAEPKTGSAGTPAILGGQPVRTAPFPRWPNFRETAQGPKKGSSPGLGQNRSLSQDGGPSQQPTEHSLDVANDWMRHTVG